MLNGLFRVATRLLLLALVVLVLWSARYRFDHIVVDGETYLVRVKRVLGHADILIPGEGWVPSEEAWSDSPSSPPANAS